MTTQPHLEGVRMSSVDRLPSSQEGSDTIDGAPLDLKGAYAVARGGWAKLEPSHWEDLTSETRQCVAQAVHLLAGSPDSSTPLEPRDISTAVRDGDAPDILASTTGRVWFQCSWDEDNQRFYTFNLYPERDKKWASESGGAWEFEPTMWVPLPSGGSPPISRAAGAAGNLAQDGPSSLSAAQAQLRAIRDNIPMDYLEQNPDLVSAVRAYAKARWAIIEACRDRGEQLSAAQAEIVRLREALEQPSETLIDAVAEAMAETFGWSINLTRMVEGVSTYTLTFPGHPPTEFEYMEDAHEELAKRLSRERALLVLKALSTQAQAEPTDHIADVGNMVVQHQGGGDGR